MTSLSVTTAPVIADTGDGRWVVREMSNRVEFLLDGRGLADLVEETEVGRLDYRATPFEFPAVDGRAVLSGRVPFESSVVDTSRVPLLVCPCGDPACGALTVRLSQEDATVVWSNWAWENQYEPPLRLDSLPARRFEVATYEQAISEAARVAAANREPMTRMRVRVPGPWWRNMHRAPQERTDEEAMLGWLMAQAVVPSIGEAEGTYFDFLVSLDTAQDLLAGAASRKRHLNDDRRQEAVAALRSVEISDHRDSLPPETLDAVRWFLGRLQG